VWHEKTKQAREAGDLVVLGVIQEQHPDRCQLFAQWQGFEWSILHDPINRLGARAVPYFIALDESGTVVDANLRADEYDAFMDRPKVDYRPADHAPSPPDLAEMRRQVEQAPSARAWSRLGDAGLLWGDADQLDQVIDDYEKSLALNASSASTHFSAGVAYRMRFDSDFREAGDFQRAIDAWGTALELDPNHYIYRRRIQQYGPRLTKPYPFYDWVSQARAEIEERGDAPVPLTVLPSGAEIASPTKDFTEHQPSASAPDPEGRINRDTIGLVRSEVVVVPGEVSAGDSLRVHVRFQPSDDAHWNNEAEPLILWIDTPEGFQIDQNRHASPLPENSESNEVRSFEFEVQTSADAKIDRLRGYALYYVCEERGGQCLYLRQDLDIPIRYLGVAD
jgi:tetratricopeptide (TPR) repeat protein